MQGQRKALAVAEQAAVLGLHQHHMVGAGGEGQVLACGHHHAGHLLHLHGTAGAHGMLVQLCVIADGAVDTEQAVVGLAIVVHHEIRRDVGGVGGQLQ
ncbi:hypothetical protein D3C77_578980 [compost metagenome]